MEKQAFSFGKNKLEGGSCLRATQSRHEVQHEALVLLTELQALTFIGFYFSSTREENLQQVAHPYQA